MTSLLNITEKRNPAAQVFKVPEPTVITKIGIFFAKAHASLPITLELRPVTEGGIPSSLEFVPGSRVTMPASAFTNASRTFNKNTEVVFEFNNPVLIPQQMYMSFCLYTSAPIGAYEMWIAEGGEFITGTNTKKYITSAGGGGFYGSSNDISWEADNNKNIAFKIYKAQFETGKQFRARINTNIPPEKKLTELTNIDNKARYTYDPLYFTQGDATLKVNHPGHGFRVGDKVELFSDGVNSFDSADTINGVSGAAILGPRVINAVDPYGYSFEMDAGSNPTETIRAGGTGLSATEQYEIAQMLFNIQYTTPRGTALNTEASLTTTSSFAGSETPYVKRQGLLVEPNILSHLKNPYVIASNAQEQPTTGDSAGGRELNESTLFDVYMETQDPNVAPYFNAATCTLDATSFFVDYQDSASTDGRNLITTIPWTSETEPDGGTTASKHITIPYFLEYASDSLVVYVDASRPVGSDFSVWYRTSQGGEDHIHEKNWVEFSKDVKNVKGKSYSEISTNRSYDEYSEYAFASFNLTSFKEYQIKITFNTKNQAQPPIFRNLRIVATS